MILFLRIHRAPTTSPHHGNLYPLTLSLNKRNAAMDGIEVESLCLERCGEPGFKFKHCLAMDAKG